jgi:hypothetical protein
MSETKLIEIVYSTREQGLDFSIPVKHAVTLERCRLELISLFERWLVALREGRYPFRFEDTDAENPEGEEMKRAVTINRLIETVHEQGCVRLKSGEKGIPRKIEFTGEGDFVTVSTAEGTGDYEVEEIEEIVFIG